MERRLGWRRRACWQRLAAAALLAPAVLGAQAAEPTVEASPATPVPSAAPPAVGTAPHLLLAVHDAAGAALAGIPVVVLAVGSDGRERDLASARTGALGEPAVLLVPETLFGEHWDAEGLLAVHLAVALPVPAAPRARLLERPTSGQAFELELDEALAAWCRPLRVRVVDAGGQPQAGIPVALDLLRSAGAQESGTACRAVTQSPDGVAVLETVAYWDTAWPARLMHLVLRAAVRVDLPLSPPVRQTLDMDLAPPGLVQLVLPPVGWLVLHVTDGTGAEVPQESLNVSWRRTDDPSVRRGHERVASDAPGRVAIGPLGLGWQLEVAVLDGRQRASSVSLQVAGPTQPGEALPLEVPLAAVDVVALQLDGQLFEASGTPSRELRLDLSLQVHAPERRELAYTELLADELGQFRWELELTAADRQLLDEGGGLLRIGRDLDAAEVPALALLCPLAPTPGSAQLALGELRWPGAGEPAFGGQWGELPATRLAGRVLDEQGRPLEAVVELRLLSAADAPQALLARTRCDAAGRYQLATTAAPEQRVELIAFTRDAPVSSRRAPLEELLEHTFVLGEGCELSGAVTGYAFGADLLAVVLRSPGHEADVSLGPPVVGGFSFRFRALPEGTYDLQVRIERSDWVLLEVPHVELQRGAPAAEPRLAALELSGRVRQLALRLRRDDDGASLPGVSLRLHDKSGLGTRRLSSDADGRLVLLVPAGVERLLLEASGFLPVWLELGDDSLDVQLQPAP